MKIYLQKLMAGESLTIEEMYEAGRHLFEGEATESESGALLGLLSQVLYLACLPALKGETADEIAGLVQAIREKSPAPPAYI